MLCYWSPSSGSCFNLYLEKTTSFRANHPTFFCIQLLCITKVELNRRDGHCLPDPESISHQDHQSTPFSQLRFLNVTYKFIFSLCLMNKLWAMCSTLCRPIYFYNVCICFYYSNIYPVLLLATQPGMHYFYIRNTCLYARFPRACRLLISLIL